MIGSKIHQANAEFTEGAVQRSWRTRWRRLKALNPWGSSIVVTFSSNYLLAALGFASGTISARLLGVEGKGELAAIQNWFWLVSLLVMLGLQESALYFAAREPRHAGRILATAAAPPVLLTPVFFFLMYPIVPLYLAAQSSELITPTRWIVLGIPLYVLLIVPTFFLRGANHLTQWNLMRLLPGLGWLALVIGAWLANQRSPVFLAIGYLGVLATLLVPVILLVRKYIPGPYWPSRELVMPMLRYGLPLAVADIHQTLNLRLDQLLIPIFLPSYALGLYVVAVAWSSASYPAMVAIANVLCPKIAGSMASRKVRCQALTQGVRLGLLAGLILAIFLLVLAPWAIPALFGREFGPAIPVAFILVGAGVLHGTNLIMEEGLRGLGETRGIFWGETLGLLVTIISLMLLLSPLGIIGAGIASVLGYGVTFLVLVWSIRTTTGFTVPSFLLPNLNDLMEVGSYVKSLRLVFSAGGRK